MSKHGLAIMIADKMPAPGKSRGAAPADDYSDEADGDDGGGDELALSTVADFFKCGKSGDYEGALGHLRDLIPMLHDGGGEEE